MLFKVDTYYLTESSAIEYAMCKLESAKKETMDNFDKLLTDAKNFAGADFVDTSLTETNAEMTDNVGKIEKAKSTYDSEMQVRF